MRASIVLALTLMTSSAFAQTHAEVHARASNEIRCLERVATDLQRSIRLLREAQDQLHASSQAARDDAARAVESLESRIDDLADAIKTCMPQASGAEQQVIVVDPVGADARVGMENAATDEVERDAQLAPYVKVVVGQRVDGHGSVSGAAVRAGVRTIASRLERCYGSLVERGALERGELHLVFTVTTSGRVTRVGVENPSIGERRFHRCVQSAGRAIRIRGSANGGDATYSYTLRFGPG